MPKLGLTMTEGTIARWDVAPGKSFAQGDIILVVETDKIAYDVEAPAPGVLQEVLVSAGSAVPVGTPIGRWDVGDIKVSLDAPDAAASTEEEPSVAPEAPKTPSAAPPPRRADAGRTLATPYARRLARQAGIDLHALDGSGPRGRIKAADVERAITAKVTAPAQMVAPTAAQTMRAATFSAGIDIDITALLKLAGGINNDIPDLHAELVGGVARGAVVGIVSVGNSDCGGVPDDLRVIKLGATGIGVGPEDLAGCISEPGPSAPLALTEVARVLVKKDGEYAFGHVVTDDEVAIGRAEISAKPGAALAERAVRVRRLGFGSEDARENDRPTVEGIFGSDFKFIAGRERLVILETR